MARRGAGLGWSAVPTFGGHRRHPVGPRSRAALAGDEVLTVVAETSGAPAPFIRAALAYWSDYPEEVDDFLHRARAEAAQAQAAWERQQGLLGL